MNYLTIEEATSILNYNTGGNEFYYAHYVIHSNKPGIFKSIIFSEDIKNNLIYQGLTVHPGEYVEIFK